MTNPKHAKTYTKLIKEYPREDYNSDTEHSNVLFDAVPELADRLVDVHPTDLLAWLTTEEGAEGVELLTAETWPKEVGQAIADGGLTELARLAQYHYHLDGLNEIIDALYVDA